MPDDSAGDIAPDVWRRLADSLRITESLFDTTAKSGGLRLLSNSRWPQLRLQGRSLLLRRELRLSLLPETSAGAGMEYEWTIDLVQYPRFAWLPFGDSFADRIGNLTDDELRDGRRLAALLDEGVARMLSPE